MNQNIMDTSLKEKNVHLLTIKVMRLTRPSFDGPMIVTTDQKDLPGNLLNDALKKDITSVPGSETIGSPCFLVAPLSSGTIYLGETFSCYICVHNQSGQLVKDVSFKALLHTKESELVLSSQGHNSTDLTPNCSVDEVIHHEVKELGDHVLRCDVSYCCSNTISSDLRTLTKYFKFTVCQPLNVKTKLFICESKIIYIEAQVQNLTQGHILLEKVSLESTSSFKKNDKSCFSSVNGLALNLMASGECKQFLYCLSSVQFDTDDKDPNETCVGRLNIVWRTNLGQRGRLQTIQLFKRVPEESRDLQITVEKIPSVVFLEDMFEAEFRITNASKRSLEMVLHFESNRGFAWCAVSGESLGFFAPGESKCFSAKLIPLSLGLQTISGICIESQALSEKLDFSEITHVYVSQRNDSSGHSV